jgi:hypothetical protein
VKIELVKEKVTGITDEKINSRKQLLLLALKRKPSLVIYLFFPRYLDKSMERVQLDLESPDEDYRQSDKLTTLSVQRLENYSRILSVDLVEYGIIIDQDDPANSDLSQELGEGSLKLDIMAVNGFNCSVTLRGYVTGGHGTFDVLEWWNLSADLEIYGIKKGDKTPHWIELLVDSALHAESGNDRMAFLNSFSALENLIVTLHDDMFFDYFLGQNTKKESVRKNIRLFANRNVILRNKLNQIINEIGFRKLKEFQQIFKKWEDLVEIRDLIAHGGFPPKHMDVPESMYIILTIIFTLGLQEDLGANEWSSLFKK